MFTIEYVASDGKRGMETFLGNNREKLVSYLARFDHSITAVYEQTTPVTKAICKSLAERPYKSDAARAFVNSQA